MSLKGLLCWEILLMVLTVLRHTCFFIRNMFFLKLLQKSDYLSSRYHSTSKSVGVFCQCNNTTWTFYYLVLLLVPLIKWDRGELVCGLWKDPVRTILKLILYTVRQGLHVPDVNMHPTSVIDMIQGKEQRREFLQDFNVQWKFCSPLSADEGENEGFLFHDQIPIHVSRTFFLHVVSPSHSILEICRQLAKRESLLLQIVHS